MIGFTTLSRSMNGIKTLSDGISIIEDGVAQHENVIYTDFIVSEDGKTEIINNKITTEIIDCQNLNADDIMSLEINTDLVKTKNIKVIDASGNEIFIGDGINKKFTFNGPTEYNQPLTIINKILNQTQGGYIFQTGTNFNTFKDSKINGYLEVGSNLIQIGGSTTLKDLTVDNLTQNANKGITQSGSGVSNTLGGTTTIKDLIITNSVIFPSEVEIPGTTTSDDIIMNGSSVITQDITVSTAKFNKLRYTKTLDLDVEGNFTMIEAGATATLKDTIIQGSTILQGDIEQTAGFTKLNTIECNNITLRTDNDLNISGTGKINQTGTGTNTLNAIVLNNNQNITFNGTGIISQPLNGTNILSNFRSAGFGIIAGRNNTTFTHYQNIQNNNGLQFQYNRDNSTFYSYFLNNRIGSGGGFRFQRYNGGVYVDEPLIIDDNIIMNKDLSLVGKSISASSATLGIITQNELDCLDNCNLNIINKFNTLDSQIASLQTTTGGVTTATTGITYNSNNDTTTIDNNLIVSTGKSLTLGNTNVNSFITDTNTFINAVSNTLQGIVYTSGNDTTTINNNTNITGNLIVQGMNLKAEIDALETSFTTGTLTTTTLTAGTLNITNLINMTNSNRGLRNINNIGNLNFCNIGAGSDITLLNVNANGDSAYFINTANRGHFQFLGNNINGVNNGNRLILVPDAGTNLYNPSTLNNDILLFGAGSNSGEKTLNLSVWSNTATGVRIQPTQTTMTGGTNNIITSSSGISINGNNGNINIVSNNNNKVIINNYDYNEETIKVSNIQLASNTYSLTFVPNTAGNNNILIATATISPRYRKRIIISSPVSLTRSFRVNNDAIVWATVNENVNISVNVFKNGVFHSTISSNTLPTNSIGFFTDQPSSFVYTYNYYCGILSLGFNPDYNVSSNNDVYQFFSNYGNAFTWSTDTLLGFIPAGFTLTLNTTFTGFTNNGNIRISPVIPSYIASNHNDEYIIVPTGSTFTQFNQPIASSEVITGSILTKELSCTNTLNANILNVGTYNVNSPIYSWGGSPPAILLNGIINNSSAMLDIVNKPILSSNKALGSSDDGFIVFPGFILIVYRYANYLILSGQSPWAGTDDFTRQTRTIDNSNGTSPILIRSSELYGSSNQAQSCRLYWKSGENELLLPYYSFNV